MTDSRRALAFATFLVASSGCASPDLLYEQQQDRAVAPLDVRLVRITEEGLDPSWVKVPVGSGGVAFVNDTPNTQVRVAFPTRLELLRCSYTVGFVHEGRGTTSEALRPGQVVSLCLHERHTVHYEVTSPGGEMLRGTLEVTP